MLRFILVLYCWWRFGNILLLLCSEQNLSMLGCLTHLASTVPTNLTEKLLSLVAPMGLTLIRFTSGVSEIYLAKES